MLRRLWKRLLLILIITLLPLSSASDPTDHIFKLLIEEGELDSLPPPPLLPPPPTPPPPSSKPADSDALLLDRTNRHLAISNISNQGSQLLPVVEGLVSHSIPFTLDPTLLTARNNLFALHAGLTISPSIKVIHRAVKASSAFTFDASLQTNRDNTFLLQTSIAISPEFRKIEMAVMATYMPYIYMKDSRDENFDKVSMVKCKASKIVKDVENYKMYAHLQDAKAGIDNAVKSINVNQIHLNLVKIEADLEMKKRLVSFEVIKNMPTLQSKLKWVVDIQIEKGNRKYKNNEPKKALDWFKKAADLDSELGYFLTAETYYNNPILRSSVAEQYIVDLYKKSHDLGSPEGSYTLGLIYEDGLLRETQNIGEAVKYYEIAQQRGSTQATAIIGDFYEKGLNGYSLDFQKAIECFKKVADRDDAQGQYKMGKFYLRGMGLPIDMGEATKYFKKSADKSYLFGSYYYGLLIEKGYVAPKDITEACKYYKISADAGLPEGVLSYYSRCKRKISKKIADAIVEIEGSNDFESQLTYADYLLPSNLADANMWYTKALPEVKKEKKAGVVEAEYYYGMMLYEGLGGLTQDKTEGEKLIKEAADKGHYLAKEFKAARGWS